MGDVGGPAPGSREEAETVVDVLATQAAMGDVSLPPEKFDRLAAHLAATYPAGVEGAYRNVAERVENPNPDLDPAVYRKALEIIGAARAIVKGLN